jgi:hypothetical protein
LEKVKPMKAVQKRNGKLRRYEQHFIPVIDPMQQPTPEHKYHIEVPGSRGEPIDVRLKNPRRGTAHSFCTCDRCKKHIVWGKTAKKKSIPISQELDRGGKPYPIPHWDDCPSRRDGSWTRPQNKWNVSFNFSSLF